MYTASSCPICYLNNKFIDFSSCSQDLLFGFINSLLFLFIYEPLQLFCSKIILLVYLSMVTSTSRTFYCSLLPIFIFWRLNSSLHSCSPYDPLCLYFQLVNCFTYPIVKVLYPFCHFTSFFNITDFDLQFSFAYPIFIVLKCTNKHFKFEFQNRNCLAERDTWCWHLSTSW